MSIYLKAKHWQLFIVLVGSMFLGQALMVNSIVNGTMPNAVVIILPMFIMSILYYGWLWSISLACYKALPNELATSPKKMQIGLIYALIYLVIAGQFFFGTDKHLPVYGIFMHLLAMAAIIYSLGFTAKQLTKLEQNKEVTFFTYSGPFFLLWFFPIGVWFIQPKVNQLLGDNNP
ncbi:MAG: hypothetical protein P8Y24_06845 [Gammaproteobacteria bacterium]